MASWNKVDRSITDGLTLHSLCVVHHAVPLDLGKDGPASPSSRYLMYIPGVLQPWPGGAGDVNIRGLSRNTTFRLISFHGRADSWEAPRRVRACVTPQHTSLCRLFGSVHSFREGVLFQEQPTLCLPQPWAQLDVHHSSLGTSRQFPAPRPCFLLIKTASLLVMASHRSL